MPVYHKPTNVGLCLNCSSECPTKFKSSVISAYAKRALIHCSIWKDVHQELDFVSQQLVNNGYSYKDILRITKRTLGQWYLQEHRPMDSRKKIKLFYRNYMHQDCRKDKAALRSIIDDDVTVTDPESVIDLIIYYKNKRISQPLMKNSLQMDNDTVKKHGNVYQIICSADGCNNSYVGMMTTKLSKRLAVHLQEGNFYQHYIQSHGIIRKPLLLQSTSVIDRD